MSSLNTDGSNSPPPTQPNEIFGLDIRPGRGSGRVAIRGREPRPAGAKHGSQARPHAVGQSPPGLRHFLQQRRNQRLGARPDPHHRARWHPQRAPRSRQPERHGLRDRQFRQAPPRAGRIAELAHREAHRRRAARSSQRSFPIGGRLRDGLRRPRRDLRARGQRPHARCADPHIRAPAVSERQSERAISTRRQRRPHRCRPRRRARLHQTITMLFYFGKIGMHFAGPLGAGLLLIVAGLLGYRFKRFRLAMFLLALFVLWAYSTPYVAQSMAAELERQAGGYTVANAPAEPAIVVLGGFLREPGGVHKQPELDCASDRLLEALRLYRANKAPLILITGGIVPLYGNNDESEAEAARSVLLEWGVPASAILMETKSIDTAQNARFSEQILNGKGIHRILLVT